MPEIPTTVEELLQLTNAQVLQIFADALAESQAALRRFEERRAPQERPALTLIRGDLDA
jgi:hypothetical protein